jgi:hypothetical protein
MDRIFLVVSVLLLVMSLLGILFSILVRMRGESGARGKSGKQKVEMIGCGDRRGGMGHILKC